MVHIFYKNIQNFLLPCPLCYHLSQSSITIQYLSYSQSICITTQANTRIMVFCGQGKKCPHNIVIQFSSFLGAWGEVTRAQDYLLYFVHFVILAWLRPTQFLNCGGLVFQLLQTFQDSQLLLLLPLVFL